MEGPVIHRSDRYELCIARGYIDPDERIARYASVGEWLTHQWERKSGERVEGVVYDLLADTNIALCAFDDNTDTGKVPDWQENYEPGLISPRGEMGAFFHTNPSVPRTATYQMQARLKLLTAQHMGRVVDSWNLLVLAMHDYKAASIVEGVSVEERVASRIHESIALADLYADILTLDPTEYFPPFFHNWLETEIIAGNLVDSLMDYREDLLDGHQPMSFSERMIFAIAGVSSVIKYLRQPMTTGTEVSFFSQKFLKHYLLPKIGGTIASASSRLSRSIGT